MLNAVALWEQILFYTSFQTFLWPSKLYCSNNYLPVIYVRFELLKKLKVLNVDHTYMYFYKVWTSSITTTHKCLALFLNFMTMRTLVLFKMLKFLHSIHFQYSLLSLALYIFFLPFCYKKKLIYISKFSSLWLVTIKFRSVYCELTYTTSVLICLTRKKIHYGNISHK